MERTEIVSQILAILEDVAEISPEDVNENSVLMDDLDLSSMEILTVVADLEETFGLRIPEKELRNFVTISDLADYQALHLLYHLNMQLWMFFSHHRTCQLSLQAQS